MKTQADWDRLFATITGLRLTPFNEFARTPENVQRHARSILAHLQRGMDAPFFSAQLIAARGRYEAAAEALGGSLSQEASQFIDQGVWNKPAASATMPNGPDDVPRPGGLVTGAALLAGLILLGKRR